MTASCLFSFWSSSLLLSLLLFFSIVVVVVVVLKLCPTCYLTFVVVCFQKKAGYQIDHKVSLMLVCRVSAEHMLYLNVTVTCDLLLLLHVVLSSLSYPDHTISPACLFLHSLSMSQG